MTTPTANTFPMTAAVPDRFRLPDIPERDPDEVSQFDHLFKRGSSHHLALHLGSPETTLVEADRWIVPDAGFDKRRARYPDLLVAFDVDPARYAANNGYVVSEQGKPPDFVLEVASPSTADADLNEKRDYYATIGVREYWRFDRTGEHYGARLYGERLTDGRWAAIPIDELPGGELQGYSAALGVYLRGESEDLVFYDPATGRPIASFESERARADAEAARADGEQTRADAAEAWANAERQARLAAEARVRELEERLLRGEG